MDNKPNIPVMRYTGSEAHPGIIEINIPEGGAFAIGRFDVSAGRRQSDFEFDKKTKAVSRRHAVITRGESGYHITDLDSAAGTIINGRRIPSGAPYALKDGCRVSFGHSGADYIWEE